jgi:hypothetical protein
MKLPNLQKIVSKFAPKRFVGMVTGANPIHVIKYSQIYNKIKN